MPYGFARGFGAVPLSPGFYVRRRLGIGDTPSCPPSPPNYGNCGGIFNLDPACEAKNAQMQLDYTNAQIACQGGAGQAAAGAAIDAAINSAYLQSIGQPAPAPQPTTPPPGPLPTQASFYQTPPKPSTPVPPTPAASSPTSQAPTSPTISSGAPPAAQPAGPSPLCLFGDTSGQFAGMPVCTYTALGIAAAAGLLLYFGSSRR